MRTLIAGGTVVTAAAEAPADVLIDGGTIVEVGSPGRDGVDRVIDARGRLVLPGGVDPHTHIDAGFRGKTTSDDFTSGTAAAARGGTTCVIDFCFAAEGQGLLAALATWKRKLVAHPPVVDVGVHMALVEPPDERLAELPALRRAGVPSLKLYMAYKDRRMTRDAGLFRAMNAAAAEGMLVMVHAENGDVIDILVRRALAAGDTTPIWHARTRPPATEGEAVARAIALAGLAGCDLYVVHVSCRDGLEPIARARAAGARVWGESCAHYLVLDERRLEGPDHQSARFVCTPPLRAVEHQEPLWRALAGDELSVLGSDHCPFELADKWPATDFTRILNGLPGVEQRLMLLHHFGVGAGRISLRRLVELTATQPARIFGLHPRKGTIAPGADADLVVFDPARAGVLTVAPDRPPGHYVPYEGMRVTGVPETVLVRGVVVVADGELVPDVRPGRFVERSRNAADPSERSTT